MINHPSIHFLVSDVNSLVQSGFQKRITGNGEGKKTKKYPRKLALYGFILHVLLYALADVLYPFKEGSSNVIDIGKNWACG